MLPKLARLRFYFPLAAANKGDDFDAGDDDDVAGCRERNTGYTGQDVPIRRNGQSNKVGTKLNE